MLALELWLNPQFDHEALGMTGIPNRHKTSSQKEYALRRVVYNAMVTAHSIRLWDRHSRWCPDVAVAKISAMIMTRNLHAFLFSDAKPRKDSDAFLIDMDVIGWSSDERARLTATEKTRINQIAGHIVSDDPGSFGNRNQARKVVIRVLRETCRFLRHCRTSKCITFDDRAEKYRIQLNNDLNKVGEDQVE